MAVGLAAVNEDAALRTGVCGDEGGVGGDKEGGVLAVEGHGAWVDLRSVDDLMYGLVAQAMVMSHWCQPAGSIMYVFVSTGHKVANGNAASISTSLPAVP